MSRVFPGVWDVRARERRLQSLLMRLLLPTLDYPATAICGSPTPSNFPYCAIEVINSAFLISNFVSPFGV